MDAHKQCPHDEGSRACRLWRRGWNACQNGKSPDQCPTSQDPDRNHWINGFTAAQLRAQLGDEPHNGAPGEAGDSGDPPL
jgi:ribosome modulation factor